ncbi:MAG TPA: SymE family type I addiction module toxin [Thermoanaerobaculia bacterium]|nr:SymE family type I addiction module toxin [Thermoanaerobaculia bacterium]
MSSPLSDAMRRLPALSGPRRQRVRKAIERPVEARKEPQPRPARAPYVLTLSSRRIVRRTLPEAVVPYLRMSGRWLEEHGFAIGSGVQVVVERGRVTLISEAVEALGPVAPAK